MKPRGDRRQRLPHVDLELRERFGTDERRRRAALQAGSASWSGTRRAVSAHNQVMLLPSSPGAHIVPCCVRVAKLLAWYIPALMSTLQQKHIQRPRLTVGSTEVGSTGGLPYNTSPSEDQKAEELFRLVPGMLCGDRYRSSCSYRWPQASTDRGSRALTVTLTATLSCQASARLTILRFCFGWSIWL